MDPFASFGLEREVQDCAPVLAFTIPGDPKAKARARTTKAGGSYTPKSVVEAEEAVAWAARAAGARVDEGSLGLQCVFYTANWRKRDVDNLLKLVADALNKVAYLDDSQVSEMSSRVIWADPNPRTEVLLYRTTAQPRPAKAPARRRLALV